MQGKSWYVARNVTRDYPSWIQRLKVDLGLYYGQINMIQIKGWFGPTLWGRSKGWFGSTWHQQFKVDLGLHYGNDWRLIWVYIMVRTEGWFGSMLWHRPLVDLCQRYISSKSRQRLTQISALGDILRCKSWPLNFLGLCKL